MRRLLLRRVLAGIGLALAAGDSVAEDALESALAEPLTLRLSHPDRQIEALLKWFDGSQAAHPAAALAAWKQASSEPERLGKTIEAVISLFNPEMVREWVSFHDAQLELGLEPGEPRLRWRLSVPHDDGTLAALVTTLRLSAEPLRQDPPGPPSIESLGKGDAVAMRGRGDGVLMASSRTELERAPRQASLNRRTLTSQGSGHPGLSFHLEPRRVPEAAAGTVPLRRMLELTRGLPCDRIDGRLAIHGSDVLMEVSSIPSEARAGRPGTGIEADWLTWIPAASTAAVVCLAIGRDPADWDRLFALADRVDRADPARADLAPLRVRLNLLAAAAGVRPERDLWPHLRGLTLAILVDPERPGRIGSLLSCLHMDRVSAAETLRDELLPRLTGLLEGKPLPGGTATGKPGQAATGRSHARLLGRFAGRPLEVVSRGSTVVIGWGKGSGATALQAAAHPEGSVRPWLGHVQAAAGAGAGGPDRFGLYWPGRLTIGALDASSPVGLCLAQGPPLVWWGWSDGNQAEDRVAWRELPTLVRRLLAAIPLRPAREP